MLSLAEGAASILVLSVRLLLQAFDASGALLHMLNHVLQMIEPEAIGRSSMLHAHIAL